MKEKICVILVLLFSLTALMGCEKDPTNKKENNNIPSTELTTKSSKYNGIYEQGKYKFYIISLADDKLEYYITNEYDDKLCGRLEYKDDMAIYEEFDEILKIKLDGDNILVESKNVGEFPDGLYKRKGNYTINEFYENIYGLSKYFNSKISGKYTNGENIIYVYQPISKYVEFYAKANRANVSCEAKYEAGKDLICKLFETTYTIKLGEDKLTYIIDSDDEKENYKGEFVKTGELSREEIMDIFDPFGLFYMEESDS